MKNLFVLRNTQKNVAVKNAKLISCDTLNQITYFATDTCITGYNLSTGEISSYISLCDNDYLEGCGSDHIISLHYLFDQDSICIATSKGDLLLWQPEMNNLECPGSVDAGFTCAEWSPDQELLILTTGNGTLVVMTKDFDPLCEYPIHTKDFGEAEPVTVGWGKKETQFHGSEGKAAAKQVRQESVTPVLTWDDCHTEISWRGDGQLFAITSVDGNTNCRYLRIFDRDGKLQATNEIVEGLENCISWRPSGNLIVCSQRKPNKHDVIFFEKNGLQHGEFTLPFNRVDKKILKLSWNMNSDVIAIVLQSMEDPDAVTVQLWTVGNYHWYLKQEMNFNKDNKFASMTWDPEDCYVLHIISTAGLYSRVSLVYQVMQSKGHDNLSMVAVIDGAKLLLTPMKLMVVPPPMSTHTVQLHAPVNMLSFGVHKKKHNIVTYLSNKQFSICDYSPNGTYDNKMVTVMDNSLDSFSLRCLTWWKEDLIVVVADHDNGNSLLFLKVDESDECGIKLYLCQKLDALQNIQMLFISEDSEQKLYLEDDSGNIYQILQESDEYSLSNLQYTLPQICCYVSSIHIDGENFVFGLTNHFRLFMNHQEIANNCTSFLLHEEFLLMTTHSHTLRSIYLKSLKQGIQIDGIDCGKSFDESNRRVERGSKLITAVRSGTLVVLQMPRGNLESIHPRALTITYLQKLLSGLDYGKAFQIMQRNRINLNLIYDHDPLLFLSNIEKFITDVPSTNQINLFLADLTAEDVCTTLYRPYYYHGDERVKPIRDDEFCNDKKDVAVSSKVDLICEAVRESIEKVGTEKYLLALLTTYAKKSQPDLESVLLKIKYLKENPPSTANKDEVTYEKALKYILYLVDVDKLFDIALGLYDFEVVLMVAEKSQKDPKEYLPFLNNFKNMEINYRKYSIDKYLKRYTKALLYLSKCEDNFEEFIGFVIERKLYKEALKLFPSCSPKYKKVSYIYGEYLQHQKLYEDAGIIFSRSGFHQEALSAFMCSTNWNMVLTEANILNYSKEALLKLCRELSDQLKGSHMYEVAAFLLETYVKDIEECVVCLLEGRLWFRVLQVVRQYDREDLMETNLKPSVLDQYEQQVEQIEDLKSRFITHKERLKVVIEKKQREALEVLEGVRDDPENDLFSDTSSVTGQSVSSIGSKGSSRSGHSRKSKNKVGRKQYRLREGSKHEDFALREALAEIATASDKMKEEVNGLLKILVYFFEEDKAFIVQSTFASLLELIESSLKEIWSNQSTPSDIPTNFGPNATVQTIIAQRQNMSNLVGKKDEELPESNRPTLRANIHWKVHLLRS